MATVQVNEDYVGLPTGGRLIPAGVYDEYDPGLYGQAHYLVSLGIALWISAPPSEEPPDQSGAEQSVEAPSAEPPPSEEPRNKRR